MCGIAGAVNYRLHYPTIKSVMGHRGPDEQNGIQIDRVDFYHLRLSILDVTGGKQPMQLHNRFTIIFNGEIYNYKELKHRFHIQTQTNSDTEVLLHLYEKMGEKMLHELDGMFVMAIYDREKKELFLSRDRAGEKPLYYYVDDDKLVFASELNVLKSLLPLEICNDNFAHYLRFGAFYKEHTPYKKVKELVAGSWMKLNCEHLSKQITKWWTIQPFFQESHSLDFNQTIEKTESLLDLSVKRRIESSDLEVGCFLSGGIDSALVTAFASRHTPKLKTLTVSFEGQYDEAPLARLMAEKYKTSHTEVNISYDSLTNDVENILAAYGEPLFDSSAIPSYYVSKAAKQFVTVVLTGDGADELFAGYRRHIAFSNHDFFQSSATLRWMANQLKNILPVSHEKKSIYNHLYRTVSFASKSGLDVFLSAGLDIMEDYTEHIVHRNKEAELEVLEDFNRIIQAPMSGLKKIMNLDFDIFLYNDVLVKMDIATMQHSLEARSPFLCKEILEFAPGIPDRYKIKGKFTKFLLRKIAEKHLPAAYIQQPKRGFEVPLKKWVNEELRDMIYDYVGYSRAYHKDLIEQTFVQQLLDDRLKMPSEKRAKILWTLFSMEVWYRRNILQSN
jgi:asparagine synthase (glutamine-hydrolysing)